MPPARERRLAWEPLHKLLQDRLSTYVEVVTAQDTSRFNYHPAETHVICNDDVSNAAMAEAIGVSESMVRKYRASDVPLSAADRIATRLGLHGNEIWGPAFHEGTDDHSLSGDADLEL